LEDPRLSRMYAALIRQRFAEWRRQVWHAAIMRSGAITMAVTTVVLLVLAFGWREHKRGRFALLKAELKHPATSRVAPPPQPGGQDVIVLQPHSRCSH
jgi:aldose 1-epimerase